MNGQSWVSCIAEVVPVLMRPEVAHREHVMATREDCLVQVEWENGLGCAG